MNEQVDEELMEIRKKRLQELTGKKDQESSTAHADLPDKPRVVTDSTISTFVTNHPMVVLDCWAPWCGPCRTLAPILEALALQYKGKIVFGKLNVDENPRTAMTYQTMSIPTLLIFKNGKLVDRIVGALPSQVIEQRLNHHLGHGG